MKKQTSQREHGLSLALSPTASTTSTSSSTSQDHHQPSLKTKKTSKRHSHPVYLSSSRSRHFHQISRSSTLNNEDDNDDNNNRSNLQRFQLPEDLHNSTSQFTDMSQRASSFDQMSPRSSISSYGSDYQKQRENSHRSTKTSDYRRYNGTVNHYGRHSNDWLFGGFSLRDTVRGGVDRLRHHGHGKEG